MRFKKLILILFIFGLFVSGCQKADSPSQQDKSSIDQSNLTTKDEKPEEQDSTKEENTNLSLVSDFSKDSLAINYALTQDKQLLFLNGLDPKLVAKDVDLLANVQDSNVIAYVSKGNIYVVDDVDDKFESVLVKENAGDVKKLQVTDHQTLAYLADDKIYLASLTKRVEDVITDIDKNYEGLNVMKDKKAPVFIEYGENISDMLVGDSHMIYIKNENLYFHSHEEFLLKEGVKEIAPVIDSPHAALIKDKENNVMFGTHFSAIAPNISDDPKYTVIGQSNEPLVNSTFYQEGKLNVVFFYAFEDPVDFEGAKFTKYDLADDDIFYKVEIQSHVDYPIAFKYDGLDRLVILEYRNGNDVEQIQLAEGEISSRDRNGEFNKK